MLRKGIDRIKMDLYKCETLEELERSKGRIDGMEEILNFYDELSKK